MGVSQTWSTGVRWHRLAVAAWLLVPLASWRAHAETYYAHGYHGGYYLTNEEEYRRCLDRLFAVIDQAPGYKTVLEIEPHTLERMQHGERFACERKGRGEPLVTAWSYGGPGRGWRVQRLREAGRQGFGMRLSFPGGAYVNCSQPLAAASLQGHTLVFSGWIRARRGKGAHLYFDAHGPSGVLPQSARRSTSVPPDGRWHQVSLEAVVPAGAVILFPQAKIDGAAGEADIDDLSLRDRQTGEELLQNGSFEQAVVPSMRDVARLERLRRYVRAGRAELVGGTYTQPILYTVDDESVIRQFALGCQAAEDALGVPVTWYAAQEPDMAGQLPQILRQAGFHGVLYRTHWAIFGSPPTHNAEAVNWVGPDGTRIPALPAYSSMALVGYGLPGDPSPDRVAQAVRTGISRPLFSNLNDLVWQAMPDPNAPWLGGDFGSGWANLCQVLPAEAVRGKDLVLTGSVRARLPGAALYIDAHDASHRVLASARSGDAPADGRWHRLEVRFRVPPEAMLLFPQGQLTGTAGDADFDALSLRVEGSAAELLSDSSFETPELPQGWSAAGSEDVQWQSQVRRGDAADGERSVRLQMRARTTPARFTTLAEYAAAVGAPRADWHDAYAGFQHRFPYGLLAGEPQRIDRDTVDLLLRTERVCALLGLAREHDLRNAWELTLMGQHHDGWVCAPVLFGVWRGYSSYAEFCATAAREARARCAQILSAAGVQPAPDTRRVALGLLPHRSFALLNVRGQPARQLVRIRFSLARGVARRPAIFAMDGKPAAAQVAVRSRHADGSAREVQADLAAAVPEFGWARYTVRDGVCAPLERVQAHASQDGVLLHSRYLQARVSRHGMLEVSDVHGNPLVRAPLVLAGRFAQPLTSTLSSARLQWHDGEPLAVAHGRIGSVPFVATTRLCTERPLVHLRLEFDFGAGTEVGAREDEPDTPRFARTEGKLRLVIPLAFRDPSFFTHGAFEVRRVECERHVTLRFAAAEGEGRGVALFPDRASAILCRKDPPALELALAYGGGFVYAPGERAPLTGRHRYDIALAFYEGNPQGANLPAIAEAVAQPLLIGTRPLPAYAWRGVRLSPADGAVLTAAYREWGDLLLRLWNPAPTARKVAVRVPGAASIWMADVRGRPQRRLAEAERTDVQLRPQGIVTIRAMRR